MNFINKFPTDEFFRTSTESFCDKIWNYRDENMDLTVTHLRAVVTFEYNQDTIDSYFDKKN